MKRITLLRHAKSGWDDPVARDFDRGLNPRGERAAVTIGVLGYAALSWLNPQRQYWHDLLCGTRLVQCLPAARRRDRG